MGPESCDMCKTRVHSRQHVYVEVEASILERKRGSRRSRVGGHE